MKSTANLTGLPMRIRTLIAEGKVKIMTWKEYQEWKYGKKSESVVPLVDDPDNTYYGLSSWLDENGALKPEYILPEFNERTKIYILKD